MSWSLLPTPTGVICCKSGWQLYPSSSILPLTVRFTVQNLFLRVLDPANSQQNNGANPDIFVGLEPNKTTAFLGEQIVVDVVLYFKNTIEVRSYQASPGWKAEGFGKKNLKMPADSYITLIEESDIKS